MGQRGQTANYRYALLGVVGVVAFVAIVAILRSGSPLSFDSDRGTLVGKATVSANPPLYEPIESTIGEGLTQTYVFAGVDYEITPIIVTSDNRVKFSINGEVTRALLVGESGSLSGNRKITVVDIKRLIPDVACAQQKCAEGEECPPVSCPSPDNIVLVTFRFEAGQGLSNTPPSYVLLADTLDEGATKTYSINGKDYTITLVFVSDTAENRPYAKFSVNSHLSESLAPGEGQLNLISDRIYLYVNDILTSPRQGMVEFYMYPSRNTQACVGTGSNVNIPLDAICCNGMATQVPTCPGGSILQCFDRELYCEGSQLRSRYVTTTPSSNPTTPFIGGNIAVNLYPQNGAPPPTIYDGGKFPFGVNIVVENVGEADIGPGTINPYATMRIEGILPAHFGVTAADLQQTLTERIYGSKMNVDGAVVPGMISNFVFSNLNYQQNIATSQQVTVRSTFCHDYETRATTEICLGDEGCKDGETVSYTSGGPLLVSGVQQASTAGGKRIVNFKISHVGTGAIYARTAGENCDPAVSNPNANVVFVDVSDPQATVRCGIWAGDNQGTVTLYNGAPQTISCTFEPQTTQMAFSSPVITIHYRYGQSIEQPIIIQPIPEGAQ